MAVLHVEHRVVDFDAWKVSFDSDPAERQKSGVRSYRVMRQVDDPNEVVIDLEFDSVDIAQQFLGKLRNVWLQPQVLASLGGSKPKARVLDIADSKQF